MGAKAKVTEKVYNKIKKECLTAKDDPKIMKKYNLGQTTVRAIRRSPSYVCFLTRTRRITLDKAIKQKSEVKEEYINPEALQPHNNEPMNEERKAEIAANVFTVTAIFALLVGGSLIVAWLVKVIFGV